MTSSIDDSRDLAGRLRATIDSLLDPHVFLEAIRDDSGTIVDFVYVDANDAACAYNHRTRSSMIGARLLEVLPGHAASGILATYAHVVDTGESLIVDGLPYFNEILQEFRRSDVRGIRVDDGLSLTWRDVSERYAEAERTAGVLDRYRLLAENASDVAYLTSPDRRLQWISPAVTRVLGWSQEDVLGREFREFMHPGDMHVAGAWRTSLESTGAMTSAHGGVSEPVRVRTASGAYLWCTLTGSIAVDSAGEVVGIVGAIHDVDELVRTRERADEQRDRLQLTLDSLIEPHAFLAPVREDGQIVDFEFVDVNRAATSYMALPKAAVIGSRLSALLPDDWLSGLLGQLAQVLETGRPLAIDDFEFRSPAMHVQHHYDIRAVPVGSLLSCTVRDVTSRIRAEQAILDSETRFRLLAENSADIVVHLRDGIAQWISPSITTALGWSTEEALGLPGFVWVHPDDMDETLVALAAVGPDGPNRHRFRMQAKDGSYHWLDAHGTPFISTGGVPDGLVISARVVDAEVKAQLALEQRARQDALTGLANREELFEHYSGRMERSPRSGHRIAVVFGDLDDFKQINDSFGHSAGDEFLKVVAHRMLSGVRRGDFVARIGGDEILVVLDGVHDAAEAQSIANKLRESVAEPVVENGARMRSTISLGVTLAEVGEEMDDVVARADKAMYAAKADGRDCVRFLAAPA